MKGKLILFLAFLLLIVFSACQMESAYLEDLEEKIAADENPVDEDDDTTDDTTNDDTTDDTPEDPTYGHEVDLVITNAGGTSITLSWTEPSDSEYREVEITYTPGGSTASTFLKGQTTHTVNSLTVGEVYSFTAKAVSTSGKKSNGDSIFITQPNSSTTINCIKTAAELLDIKLDPSGYFILTEDVDLSNYSTGGGWPSICDNSGPSFTGTFDGNNHSVSNMIINRSSESYLGFFGFLMGARIRNIQIVGVNITGLNHCGGLIGYSSTGSSIQNCSTTGTISASGYNTGGLIGYTEQGDVTLCHSTASVSNVERAGGLIGSSSSATITRCYATGEVYSSDPTTGIVGGLIGRQYRGFVSGCYSRGKVRGYNSVGGFMGQYDTGGSISDCYSTGEVVELGSPTYSGGFLADRAGATPPIPTDCFYDTNTSGMSDTGRGEPLTTAQMKLESSFIDYWDFTNTWAISSTINDGYPYLQGMAP